MPKPKRSARSVDSDVLRQLKDLGAESVLLDLRLEYMELEGIARYLRKLVGRERVHPHMLPTQASGRWSTTSPPLVNFPAHAEDDCDRCQDLKARGEPLPHWCPRAVREVILPDEGWYFVHYDLNAIEGRFGAADAHDEEELDAYRKNEDVHTVLGAAPMFGMPAPPIRTKGLHTASDPASVAWREAWIPPWSGSEDRRRHLAKTLKYATLYGKDHRGAATAKGVEKLRLTKAEVERFAKVYLKVRSVLTAHKARRFEEYARTNVSYTFRGRRRRLFGDAWTRAKEGWSHRLQGAVPDIMNDYIIQVANAFPEGYIVLNSHDGLTWAMPGTREQALQTVQTMKRIVERDWDYEGVSLPVAADWEIIYPDGTKEKVK
jgi:DNA polymerase I-like protein with 3'-5' exonuclease and polymerase domains